MRPIWQDYEVLLGSADSIAYTIVCDGVTIYSGIAVMRPGESFVFAKINNVCANYLRQELPNILVEGVTSAPIIKDFDVVVDGNTIHSITFVYDYSYDYAIDYDNGYPLSNPIDGIVDYRMPLLRTNSENTYDFNVYNLQGGQYDDSFDTSYANELTSNITDVQGNYVKRVVDYLDKWVVFEGVSDITPYKVINTCAKYALYYVNAYGGWDSLVMQGTPSKSDEFKRFTMQREYYNNQSASRGEYNYATEVTPKWTLKTGLLSDDQVSRMHHLLGSVQVYLFDIEEQRVYPVIIADTSAEYKTYKANGLKRSQYTINVNLASNRERR